MSEEKLKEIGIHGMLSPFKLSCAQHDGAQRWRMMQWNGKKFDIVSDWIPAPDPKFIRNLVEASAENYAKEHKLPVRECK